MKGNLHVRFLEEGEGAIPSSYSAIARIFTDLRASALSPQSMFHHGSVE
jgi:hypothetical protein